MVRGNVLGGGRWVLLQNGSSSGRLDVLITGNRFPPGCRGTAAADLPGRDPSDNSYLGVAPLPGS